MTRPKPKSTRRSLRGGAGHKQGALVSDRVAGLLSDRARRYATQHPRQAAAAAAAAIEGAAAAASEVRDATPSPDDAADPLAPFILDVDWSELGLINASEAAERLGVNRKTVYDWIERGKLLGWQTSRQRYAIPEAQILGRERIVAGIREVLEIIGDPEIAWSFLSAEWPFAEDVARPIDKLRAGDIEAVLDAAPGFGSTPR